MSEPHVELPSIVLGLVTLLIIIMGILGVILDFEAMYNPAVTNYTVVTDGLLTNSTTHDQVTATSGMIATVSPNIVWLFILFVVIAIIYAVHRITKRKRGKLITRRRRL